MASPTGAPSGTPACIILGMAGSGKTTLMQRLNAHLYQRESPGYFINLDPAVRYMPYSPNIDIRDTVNYKEVMEQYNLGPNGGNGGGGLGGGGEGGEGGVVGEKGFHPHSLYPSLS